jgi:phosphoribosylformylglycinamidine synthase
MAEACTALDFPVVSGNVSLYNETGTTAVQPTPSIGGVGILDNLRTVTTLAFKSPNSALVLVGETRGHFGASLFLREIAGREDGAPPRVDLNAERRNGDFVRHHITTGKVLAAHDCSDGGLLVAVAEMAMAGAIGAALSVPAGSAPLHAFLFGEDQARYVLEVAETDVAALLDNARAEGVPAARVGATAGQGPAAALTVNGAWPISVAELRAVNEAWLPAYMSGNA